MREKMPQSDERIVIGVDPGKAKCGIAVVGEKSGVLWSGIIGVDEVESYIPRLFKEFGADAIVIGSGTGSRELVRRIAGAGIDKNLVVVADERFTTLEARRRYFKEHPPKGLRRLIPISLQTPPEPYDQYAAILLAERYLAKRVRDE
ncbi:MAG: pre-16S rRNA-processing nuclease YqgF [Armatimonadota bacterium]|nr:pre-16S rRNA-processing nuclease YqgF [Armatimonadota bacterium]MDW8024337.1 pre-16S rRNA-processing nuclease YqgF [Armatimonadota bacterium]